MFDQYGKTLTERQCTTLVQSGKSPKIKGLTVDGLTADAVLVFDGAFNVVIEG